MSVISTCRMNDANPFQYLTDVEKHASEAAQNIERWLPWNYSAKQLPSSQPP